MRYSQMLIPTVKEVPAEAEIPSHRLMIRAGFIRKLASGTYTYLPLGLRILQKIMDIVRAEMNAAGAQEILMPVLQPMELWQQTGRDADYGQTMCRFTDRHGRENVLAPTAEEVVTSLVAGNINSYKQLPVNLYQINVKFRDEFRPRFGVLRSREFIMKDAYSFDASEEGLEESYRKMYEAYRRIFDRCGLKYVVVEAQSGPIGGDASHEFMIPCDNGEDIIVHNEDYSYAANIEKAEVDPPEKSPASAEAEPMQEVHTPGVGTIESVCEFLSTEPHQMIKTLIYCDGKNTIAALIRGDHEMNPAKLSAACSRPGLELADEAMVRKITAADVGFAGPAGLASRVDKLVVDHAVAVMAVGVGGANKTDYHVRNVVPGRDFALEDDNIIVSDIRNAAEGDTHKGQKLCFSRGVEVGHVFKLGTKYSSKLNATFLDENGRENACVMGCYGIGINRILAGAIEIGHDDDGCVLPMNIAPFEVEVLAIGDSDEVAAEAGRIYDELISAGADALLDDRKARAGVKFKDSDMLGIPLRVIVAPRSLKDGKVEIKRRTDSEPLLLNISEAVSETMKIIEQVKSVTNG